MRILLVEDDEALRHTLCQAMRQEGYGVDAAADGRTAQHALATGGYDLVVLDLALPRLDGLEVLRRLRGHQDRTPVLVLTARDGIEDRVAGLDYGADDYMTKPFALPELEARVRALLRRAGGGNVVLKNGALVLDCTSRQVTIDGEPLEVSPREVLILEALMQRIGQAVIKTRLARQLSAWDGEIGTNAIEVYVHRLRKKLEPHGVKIRTIHGLGYLLDPAE